MRDFTRATAVTLITAGLVLGATGCAGIELPDRTDRPNITLPTAFPTRDSGEGPGSDDGGDPPVEEQPAPDAEPEVVPDDEQPAPPADDASVFPWWLAGIAALLVMVVLIIVGQRRRTTREWDRSLSSVRTDVRWLDEAVIADVLSKSTTADAGAAWAAAKPRALTMDEKLFALQSQEQDDERTARAAADLAALRALVAAMDAETSTLQPGGADDLRARRVAVEQARTALRARWSQDS